MRRHRGPPEEDLPKDMSARIKEKFTQNDPEKSGGI